MPKLVLLILLSCMGVVLFSDTAFARLSIKASFTSEPAGVDVVVRKSKSQKVVGKCITPCSLKLKTKRDFTVSFRKVEHSSLYTNKSRAVEKDGVLTFHATLKSMDAVREAQRLKKASCAAKKLPPKGGEIDRNAKPLVKVVTKKPSEIAKGEFCKLKFDVTADGKVENIDIIDCQNPVFEKLSRRVLPKWKYVNALSDGCPIPKTGVETIISFN